MTQAPTKETAPSIKDAADRLQRTLKNLEASLAPMLERVRKLERQNEDVRSHESERAHQADKLADELEALRTKHDGLLAREQEFTKLASETTQELDAVISQVLQALDDGEN